MLFYGKDSRGTPVLGGVLYFRCQLRLKVEQFQRGRPVPRRRQQTARTPVPRGTSPPTSCSHGGAVWRKAAP